jgi:hypothetical protein
MNIYIFIYIDEIDAEGMWYPVWLIHDSKTYSVRNVFQSREAWEVDIQPHIWT